MPACPSTTRIAIAAAVLLATMGSPVHADSAGAPDLSLEELLKVEVQTASRKAQRLQDVAAAAYVITREDIERSGATSLPEVLRLAPGVQVARLANNRWAVSSRGFNGRFANKLLVLMDGRSIYSPLFSGVLWEMEDTLLEDIDRIEVIRGPGAALWGANAVNGVINIITRHARDTRGTLAVAGAGTEEKAFAAVRHGLAVGEGHLRWWAKAFERDTSVSPTGQPGNDDWRAGRAGLRGDWNLGADRRFTAIGTVYGGPTGDRWHIASITSPTGVQQVDIEQRGQGVNLLGRHEWTPADGSASTLQFYVDRTELEVVGMFGEQRTTIDVDFQHRVAPGGRHDVIWGLSHRQSRDRVTSSATLSLTPERRTYVLSSAFVHDEITLVPERLRLVAGARLEHNNFTGYEPQPNARVIWTPSAQQAWWGAVSRAVRTPSRAEQDATIDLAVTPPSGGMPAVLLRNVALSSGTAASAERVTAFELGHRHRFDPQLSIDLALFHNRYDRLRAGQLGAQRLETVPFPYVVQEISPSYTLKGRASGFEVVADWVATPNLRLQANYAMLNLHIEAPTGDPIAIGSAIEQEASAPRHQAALRLSWSLPRRQQFDAWLRHAGRLPATTPGSTGVPSYTTLDLRYAWRAWPGVELSVVGQNLLDARHAEFVPDLLPSEPLRVERGWYVKAKWQF